MTKRLVLALALLSCNHSQPGGGGGGGQSGGGTAPVPAEVRKTADAVLGPNAKITSERENNVTIYEAAIETKLEIEMSDTGKLLKTEIALPIKALPAAVAAAVKGTISEAEVVVTPTGVMFAVEVGDTEHLIDPSGKIVGQEREADKPGDDDD